MVISETKDVKTLIKMKEVLISQIRRYAETQTLDSNIDIGGLGVELLTVRERLEELGVKDDI